MDDKFEGDLLANPEAALEMLAILTRRAGGEIRFGPDDDIGPFDLRCRILADDEGNKFMRLNLVNDTPMGSA